MNNNQVADAIEKTITNKINQINTCIPGEIVSWNQSTNMATVRPKGMRTFEDGRTLPYPLIVNVPVQHPVSNSGNSGVTLPIKSGDGCSIYFSQDNMQTFLSKTNTEDQRKFQLSDAFCSPGLYSSSIPNCTSNPNDVCLFNNNNKVVLGSNGFSGTLEDGTTFSFSGGDLVVNGISLTTHVHGGVQTGGSTTSTPQ